MTTPVATRRKPFGNPTSQAEIMRRMDYVEELITQGVTTRGIRQLCMDKWSISSITVDRYIARVREQWIEARESERAYDVETTIARLTRAARKLEAKRAWSPWMQAEKMLIEVKGVNAPQKVDHRVAAIIHQAPVQLPPDEVLRELSDVALEELDRAASKAREQKALPAPAALNVIDVPSSE